MPPKRRTALPCGGIAVCAAGILIACQTVAGQPPAGSAVLLDFEDDAHFARLRLTEGATTEPAPDAPRGRRAARVVFPAVPAGSRGYPAVVVEGDALAVRDFSPFEAISLWVMNPGPDDAELSLAVWDKDGNRGFPSPSTVTVKPGRWQQVVSRLVLHGLDAKHVGSVHLYQKANRRPVTLLIDDVQLLSPSAGRLAARIQSARDNLKGARASADALGARGQVEPLVAALARRLDELERPGGAGSRQAEQLRELARVAKEAQDLAGSIRVRNAGKNVFLGGPHVEAGWLADPARLRAVNALTLSQTGFGDEGLAALAGADGLEVLALGGKRFTGSGLDKVAAGKLRALILNGTGAHDAALASVGRFHALLQVHLAETGVTGGVLSHFEGLKQLKTLVLSGSAVSDVGFADVGGLTSLETLLLDRTKITGDSLRHLAGLARLRELDLDDTKVDDAGVAHLGKLTRLESLSLADTPITGAGFGEFAALNRLVALNLNNTRVGDSALRRLGKLPGLKRLELSSTRVTDGGLGHVLPPAKLEYLDLYGTNVTDAGLAHVQNQRGLRDLYLGGTQMSDAGVSYLANLTGLEQLDLGGTAVTDAGLSHLRGMTNLVALKLGKTRVAGDGLVHLGGLSKLRVLDLSGTGVTDAALAPLARLPNLRTLLLGGTRVTGEGLRQLAGARQLVELDLEATGVGDAGLESLAALPNLQRLNLNETAVTDQGLKHLKALEKLRDLSLNHTRVTDDGLAHLRDTLATLGLTHTRITDRGVGHLQRFGQLVSLRLGSTGVTNDTLRLLQTVPSLRQLDLAETPIDDAGLQHLALLPELQEVNLNGTGVSDRGIDSLLGVAGLRRVSLENSRVTARGASYLKQRAPGLKVDLVFPWVWGERWSHYDLAAAPGADTALLDQLKGLTSLGSLHLGDALLTPEALRSLKDLPTLEHLSFRGTSVTDGMLADLLGLSQVVKLDLSDTGVTDGGLIHLGDLRGLRELSLRGTRVTGRGLLHLADLNRLQALNLGGTPLADEHLAHLAGLSELRALELSGTRLTDAAVEHLLRLPRLQYLDLYGAAITDAGAAGLGRLTSLRYCYLSNTRLTDAGVEHLGGLTELEELALDGTRLTDRGLAVVRSLPNLRRLRVGRTQVTDAGLSQIAGAPNVSRLELDGLPVTDAGVESLRGMSNLWSLSLAGTRVTDDALRTLADLPALAELNVRDTAVTAGAVARFREARPGVAVAFGATRAGYPMWAIVLAVVYGIAVCAICFYGVHRYWLAWLLVRDRQARTPPEPAGRFADLPAVTVQLPMFNERHVAERIIEAACALDYPRDRLQIQVLDDSTDDSAAVARRCCERLAAAGHPVEYVHRPARDGFKGGALAAALKTATGELVAVFDADFVPDRDFLRETVHHFTDPKVGMVQAEWTHLNRGESMLTELQAMFLDGHFVVEQTVRARTGRWFNFNGTAGVWRKACIDDAGGWQHDTLTEDTDLSYRAQLKGWKFLYLPTVRCGGELPSTVTAFLGQQHRWTKGLIQTGKKLLPRILLGRAPWRVKAEAWFHLTSPVMYLVMFVVTAIALPALFLATPFADRQAMALGAGLGALLLGTFAAATFYAVSQRAQGYSLGGAILKLPLLMALGIGLCAVNARAVLEGLLGLRSPFVRTPKFGGRSDCDFDPSVSRRRARVPAGVFELAVAGVLFACLVLSFLRPVTLIGAPFLLLFALGYAGVGLLGLTDRAGVALKRPRPVLARFAAGGLGVVFLAGVTAATFLLSSPPTNAGGADRERAALGVDLTTASWQAIDGGRGAIKRVYADRGSLVLGVQLDETADQGEIVLNLDGALKGLGDSMGSGRQLAFAVEYPSWFTGEFQAFARDGAGRSEYGSMELVEGHDLRRAVTVSLVPGPRTPPMGYRDDGFDAGGGLRQIGLKISAQSDRVRGAGYRPFRGTIRVAKVRVTDVDRDSHPEPEVRPPAEHRSPSPGVLTEKQFLAAGGVDRPWPLGYGFSGPLTPAHRDELERTYAAVARTGCRFTRVYVGDYRTGLVLDAAGQVTGVEPDFVNYLDQLAEVANRHGITVMFSLTDNTMADGRGLEGVELIRDGEASDRFVNNVLAEFVRKLRGRQVIWDVFNEPENVTALPLRDVQRYIDRVLAAGRRADECARFTVVSRSRPEVVYWRGRGLALYSHNIFTDRSLAEAVAGPADLDAPVMVAEMAPGLATRAGLSALREAGYAGVGIWGWGTRDKYEWRADSLARVVRPLTSSESRD